MLLIDWFDLPDQKDLTQDAFGARIGVTQGRVSQIMRNGTRDFPIMQRINEATNGLVKHEDLLPENSPAATEDA